MKGRIFSFVLIAALAFLASCHTAKKSATGSASIVGKYWKLVELNGVTVQSADQLKREPHMILNASENKVNGNSGCNSFFGSFELQAGNVITFSKIGSTRMACPNEIMQGEHQLLQVLEMTNKFSLENGTLILLKADMSPLAKFVVGGTR
jgi:heat shock protein HslJ